MTDGKVLTDAIMPEEWALADDVESFSIGESDFLPKWSVERDAAAAIVRGGEGGICGSSSVDSDDESECVVDPRVVEFEKNAIYINNTNRILLRLPTLHTRGFDGFQSVSMRCSEFDVPTFKSMMAHSDHGVVLGERFDYKSWLDSETKRSCASLYVHPAKPFGVCTIAPPVLDADGGLNNLGEVESVKPINVFNLFEGFEFDGRDRLYDEAIDRPNIGLFLDLVRDVVSGGASTDSDECYTYIINHFARIFQHPEIKSEVCPILTGGHGTGKDTITNAFGSLFGVANNNFVISTRPKEDVFGRFNDSIKNAIVVKFEELSLDDSKEDVGKFKAYITARELSFETKNMPIATMIPSFHNFIATTNESIPAMIEKGDRRFCIFESKGTHKGDVDYWNALYKSIDTVEFRRSFARFLRCHPIPSSFHPSRSRPMTSAYVFAQQSMRSWHATFLENLVCGRFDEELGLNNSSNARSIRYKTSNPDGSIDEGIELTPSTLLDLINDSLPKTMTTGTVNKTQRGSRGIAKREITSTNLGKIMSDYGTAVSIRRAGMGEGRQRLYRISYPQVYANLKASGIWNGFFGEFESRTTSSTSVS